MDCSDFEYSTHAVKRMLEKGISGFEVEQTILFGEVLQDYESDKPYPSKLLLKFVKDRPVHVVVAKNLENGSCIVSSLVIYLTLKFGAMILNSKTSHDLCNL